MVMIKGGCKTKGKGSTGNGNFRLSARTNDLFRVICYLYDYGPHSKTNLARACGILSGYKINSALLFLKHVGIIDSIKEGATNRWGTLEVFDLTKSFRENWNGRDRD
jgi:hypothetical protein